MSLNYSAISEETLDSVLETNTRSGEWIYAQPRHVPSIADCTFYHTMNLPGHGTVEGHWDLRGGVDNYLGHANFAGKRVLDVGTASGHLCFEMEKRGAEVVAFDLAVDELWDFVPFIHQDAEETRAKVKPWLRKLHNGFWLAHAAMGSKAKVCHARVYEPPAKLGKFDTALLGSILLHLRDPMLALERIADLVTDTIIVTDMTPALYFPLRTIDWLPLPQFVRRHLRPGMYLQPGGLHNEDSMSWWQISPELVMRHLKLMGFATTHFQTHRLLLKGRRQRLYTIVAQRAD